MCVEIWKEEIHRTRPEPLQTERIRNGSGSSGRKIMLVWKQKSELHLSRIQFWSQNSLPRKVAHSKPRTHYQPDPVEFKLPGWSFVSPVQRICPKTVCCGEIERPSWKSTFELEEQNALSFQPFIVPRPTISTPSISFQPRPPISAPSISFQPRPPSS